MGNKQFIQNKKWLKSFEYSWARPDREDLVEIGSWDPNMHGQRLAEAIPCRGSLPSGGPKSAGRKCLKSVHGENKRK